MKVFRNYFKYLFKNCVFCFLKINLQNFLVFARFYASWFVIKVCSFRPNSIYITDWILNSQVERNNRNREQIHSEPSSLRILKTVRTHYFVASISYSVYFLHFVYWNSENLRQIHVICSGIVSLKWYCLHTIRNFIFCLVLKQKIIGCYVPIMQREAKVQLEIR